MYIIQNALKNLVRNKGRNILVGLVLLAIIATTVISLVINSTTTAIIDDYRTRFGAEVFISPDIEKLNAEGRRFDREPITAEMHDAFATSPYLREAIFTAQMPAMSYYLLAVGQNPQTAGNDFNTGGATIYPATMKLIANSDTTNLPDFPNGFRQITDGRMYSGINEAIISMDFAEINDIQVGDVINIRSNLIANTEPFLLTVVGIYFDATNATPAMPSAFSNRRNEIFVSYETIRNSGITRGFEVNASYFLTGPDYLTAFTADVRAMGLSYDYLVTVDEVSYLAIVGPVEGLRSISITFMIVVLALGSVILILLSSIAIRERKYEIGVLRAMGMKKGKVALGLLCEMIAITTICLILGLGTGTIAAQPVADILLAQQLEAAEGTNQNAVTGGQVMVAVTAVTTANPQALSEIDVRLGGDAIIQIILIALLLAIISSAVGIGNITKYEPIKILMERN
jgi:putative ABC transport system permease protein